MLYIVTEDSTSARDFWECVARTFRGNGNYVMVKLPSTTAGNTTLKDQVDSAITMMSRGDELFVAFDNVYPTKKFVPATFVLNTTKKCMDAGISFYYTDYYCFEELYLSYKELFNMTSRELHDAVILDALYCVKEGIRTGVDYFIERPLEIQRFIDKNSDIVIENREHFANHLLLAVTKRLRGFFGIIKAKKCFSVGGRCWLRSCDDIKSGMTKEHIHNICDSCSYCCRGMSTRDKLLDLDKKSYSGNDTYGLSEI